MKYPFIFHLTLKNSSEISRGRIVLIAAETEVQIDKGSCPKSHSKLVAEPGVLKTWCFNDKARGLSISLTWSHFFPFVLAFTSTKLCCGVEMAFGNLREENKALPESKP